jgi:hypothetical protein
VTCVVVVVAVAFVVVVKVADVIELMTNLSSFRAK